MPISQARISPLLDAAARLLVVMCRQGRELARKEIALVPQSPAALARSVAEQSVDVLLCAAISESLFRELERLGVQVQPHLCGETEAVLKAYGQHHLHLSKFRMPGCRGWRSGGRCCHSRRGWRLLNVKFNTNT